MRNDNLSWDVPIERKFLELSGLTIRQIRPKRMTVISGPFASIRKSTGIDRAIGWPEAPDGEPYLLRLRRDRVLMVNGPDLADGWNAELGLAISDMTCGYAVFEIKGADAMAFLRRGAGISLRTSSASVNRLFHGLAAMIYSWNDQNHFRVHVASPMQDAFWMLARNLANAADEHVTT
ncbi:hypothetical protein [Oricola sp.]|uniref:hypothetical protein n=1 Tax=Oricola sp. TaxID=1979950 RepID=UPI0025F53A4F|nr:hypothetical protein [Oricola sp.]MCI5076879.1 hypothetical protein [Oricola sp.]